MWHCTGQHNGMTVDINDVALYRSTQRHDCWH